MRKNKESVTACDDNTSKLHSFGSDLQIKNTDNFPFLQSKVESSGIIIQVKSAEHYFELKRIHSYTYLASSNSLIFKYSGQNIRTAYGELASKLHSALSQWHGVEGRVINE